MKRHRFALGPSCLAAVLMLLGGSINAAAATTVEFWQVWGTRGSNALQKALAPFEAAHPDIQVKLISASQGTKGESKLTAAVAAGSPPDIALFVSPITDLALHGLVQPLDSYVQASTVIRRRDYPSGVLDMFSVNGHTYGIPGIEVGPWLAFAYNKTLFAAAGVSPGAPATLSDLLSLHKKLTRIDSDNRVTQLAFDPLAGMGGGYGPITWPAVFGFKLYDPADHRLMIDTPDMRNLFDYVKSFYERPSPDQFSAFKKKYGGWMRDLKSGHVAMQMQGYYAPGNLDNPKYDPFGYDWFPTSKRDHLAVVGGWGMTIPTGAKHAQAAFQVIEYLTTAPAAQAIFAANGWLNANLAAMRTLDASAVPGIDFFMNSLSTADRVLVPENIPIMLDIRSKLPAAMRRVATGRSTTSQELPNLQSTLQAKLDDVLKNTNRPA